MGSGLATTRVVLLERVRDRGDVAAWTQFVETYREMLLRACKARGLQHADAEDAVQLIFTKLVSGLRRFEYDPGRGRFRDYLFSCARSAVADLQASKSRSSTPGRERREDSGCGGVERSAWEQEWVDHHYRLAVSRVRQTADPQSIEVLEGTLAGLAPRQIALRMGLLEPAVYKVQQRMRDRLKAAIADQVRREDVVGVASDH